MRLSRGLSAFLIFFLTLAVASFLLNRFPKIPGNPSMMAKEQIVTEGKALDIAGAVSPQELKTEESGDVFLYDGLIKRQIIYLNNPISQLNFSPTGDKFGYFVNYSIFDENIPFDKQVALRIEDARARKSKGVFYGSYRTSGWEWFSDKEILVSESCGSECQAEFYIDLDSGKEYTLQYGVDYTWSPNKDWVFAYNYSYRTGITVGDRFGRIILRHNIRPPENETANTPLAVWSPDSEKLALVMKKSNDKEFELVIFDSQNKFKRIFQSNADYVTEFKLTWSEDSKKVFLNDKEFQFE